MTTYSMDEYCPECSREEYTQHKMSCDSGRVFNAYLVIRDADLRSLTNYQLSVLYTRLQTEMEGRIERELIED